jgi:hypothetical protein
MIKKIILFILIIKNNFTFIKNFTNQEYTVECEKKNYHCKTIHFLYEKCGSKILDLWLKLDIFFSVTIDFDYYEILFNDINQEINTIHKLLTQIKNCILHKNHREDTIKINFYLEAISEHQIIQSIEEIEENFLRCQKVLI